MKIGSYLKQIRLSKGGSKYWSLRAVAQRASMSNAYLSQLENNQCSKPTPKILQKLASTLGISYEETLRITGYLPPESKKINIQNIPILGTSTKKQIKFIANPKAPTDFITLSKNLIKNKNSFALKVSGEHLKEIGISNGDIIIAATDTIISNNSIIIVKADKSIPTIKRLYNYDNKLILESINKNSKESKPIIIEKQKKAELAILGEIVLAIKKLNP